MERIVERGLLYDFYGELLTEHQRRIYEDAVSGDLSPSEIAEQQGISRQGVHDLVRRCQKALEGYEEKLHLVDRFLAVKEKVGEIDSILTDWEERKQEPEEIIKEIRGISATIIEEL